MQALNEVFQELLNNPRYLPVTTPTYAVGREPPITFYEDIKLGIFANLYQPLKFPALAEELALVISRNFSFYENPKRIESFTSTWNQGKDAFWGIACSDAKFRAHSLEDMYPLVDLQQNISSFADVFFPQIWPCAQWKMNASERYSGGFRAKTKFPILFVNGPYDPITPLESAFNASEGFEGSVVLTRNAHGVRLSL